MGSKSNFLENRILDHILGGPDYVRSANVHMALYTVTPGEAGGGTEVTGGGYTRVAVVNNATNFPAAVGGLKSNGTIITFPEATASWGTIVAFAILDAPTGGNFLYWSPLNTIHPNWAATTAYTLGSFVRSVPGNGFRYEATTAGTSAATQPTWPTTIGATVSDGTVVWTCRDVAPTTRLVEAGDTVRFVAGDLVIRED